MGDTPNRRAAAAAAREFLQAKVDRVGDLAEAARAIDAALEARAAADRHITDCQRAYGQTRRAAIAAGWTESELEQLGWPPEHGPQPQGRRRPAASRRPAQPLAAAAPEPGPAEAGDAAATASTASVQRESGHISGEPSAALPDGVTRTQALGHEAAPVHYPDPQHIG